MNDLKIIYEDNHLIVVIKKPNIPVQLDESNEEEQKSLNISKRKEAIEYYKKYLSNIIDETEVIDEGNIIK